MRTCGEGTQRGANATRHAPAAPRPPILRGALPRCATTGKPTRRAAATTLPRATPNASVWRASVEKDSPRRMAGEQRYHPRRHPHRFCVLASDCSKCSPSRDLPSSTVRAAEKDLDSANAEQQHGNKGNNGKTRFLRGDVAGGAKCCREVSAIGPTHRF